MGVLKALVVLDVGPLSPLALLRREMLGGGKAKRCKCRGLA